jgi:uncharacterized membrane protein YheB (UPF0754 family)
MIYTLPFIAAIIGWFTNYIAVKMLFRPRNKVKFLFFEIQGIFPKRQHVLAEKIGKMVANELLSSKDIKEKLQNPENVGEITKAVESKVDNYLKNTFSNSFPLLSIFVGDKTRERIKNDILAEVHEMSHEVVEKYVNNIEEKFDVEEIIRQRVSILSAEKLEDLIMSILKKEFRFIEAVGAVIGFFIGIVQIFLARI